MNDVEKIDDCMVDVFCNAYVENKKTILVLASRMVPFVYYFQKRDMNIGLFLYSLPYL